MPNDKRSPKLVPDAMRRMILNGPEYQILEKSLVSINPDAELSQANNFEELCHELELTICGLEGEIMGLVQVETDWKSLLRICPSF